MKKKQIILVILAIIMIILFVTLIVIKNKNSVEENKQNINVETGLEVNVNELEGNAGTFTSNKEEGKTIQVEN